MVEELEQAEKEEQRAKTKTRFLWAIIIADILLFSYAVYEIIAIAVSNAK